MRASELDFYGPRISFFITCPWSIFKEQNKCFLSVKRRSDCTYFNRYFVAAMADCLIVESLVIAKIFKCVTKCLERWSWFLTQEIGIFKRKNGTDGRPSWPSFPCALIEKTPCFLTGSVIYLLENTNSLSKGRVCCLKALSSSVGTIFHHLSAFAQVVSLFRFNRTQPKGTDLRPS